MGLSQELKDAFTTLSAIDADAVVKSYVVNGSYPLEAARYALHHASYLGNGMKQLDLSRYPERDGSVLLNSIREFINAKQRVEASSGSNHNASGAINHLDERWSTLWNEAAKAVLFVSCVDEQGAMLRMKDLDHLRGECESLKVMLMQQIEKAAVRAEARHFTNESQEWRDASWRWLCAAIIAFIILVLGIGASLTFAFLYPLDMNASAANIIASKLIAVSALTAAVVFCARNYAAARHNAIINTHRSVALQTFEAFLAGTSDESTKAEILRQAAKTIFQAQPSGYLRNGSEASAPTELIEIVRTATKGGRE